MNFCTKCGTLYTQPGSCNCFAPAVIPQPIFPIHPPVIPWSPWVPGGTAIQPNDPNITRITYRAMQ